MSEMNSFIDSSKQMVSGTQCDKNSGSVWIQSGNVFVLCLSCTRMIAMECPLSHVLARYVDLSHNWSGSLVVTTCRLCVSKILCPSDESVEERSCCLVDAFDEIKMSPSCLKNTPFHDYMMCLTSGGCRMGNRKGGIGRAHV